jgi:hypothetical protein
VTGLVGVGSCVAGGDEDIDPRGGEFQELLVLDGDLAPRPVEECLTEAEADRQLRAYLDKLLPDVLAGRIEPGRVFDRNVGLDGVPDGYRAMADREVIKVMVTP